MFPKKTKVVSKLYGSEACVFNSI